MGDIRLSASERRGAHAMLGDAEALARLLRDATRGRLSLAVTDHADPARPVLSWQQARDAVDAEEPAALTAAGQEPSPAWCGDPEPHAPHEHHGGTRWCEGR